MDALLDFAFDRYFETSGLFGTPDSCVDLIDQLKLIDVNEIACLIDYGVPSPIVMENLAHLNVLREKTSQGEADTDYSIAALIRQHQVTHLQFTPSQAAILLMDEGNDQSISQLDVVMVGGEALPVTLAKKLEQRVSGQVINMYGPTETTIWSTTYPLRGTEATVPIGRPIANTRNSTFWTSISNPFLLVLRANYTLAARASCQVT